MALKLGVTASYLSAVENGKREIPASWKDINLILIKESVYYGACNGNPRDRFTIAHEIGHYILHSGDAISFARSDEKIKAYQNPEWQANTFAAELLVPVDKITNKSAYEISKTYNVSHKVAQIQLKFVN